MQWFSHWNGWSRYWPSPISFKHQPTIIEAYLYLGFIQNMWIHMWCFTSRGVRSASTRAFNTCTQARDARAKTGARARCASKARGWGMRTRVRVVLPVVPYKAVVEVSKKGHYRRGKLFWCMDGRANWLMDRKVVGVVFFEIVVMVAVVTSPTTAARSVV